MCEVGKAPRRSKEFTLDALKDKLGKVKHKDLTRERLIQFSKERAKEGADPVTLSADLDYLKLVLTHAAAVHGVDVKVEPVNLAHVALKRLGLVGKSRQRDRRSTADEIKRLLEHFDNNRFLLIPMGRIVRFAIAAEVLLRLHHGVHEPPHHSRGSAAGPASRRGLGRTDRRAIGARRALGIEQEQIIRGEYFGGAVARRLRVRPALVNYVINDIRTAIDPKRQVPPEFFLEVPNADEIQQWLFSPIHFV